MKRILVTGASGFIGRHCLPSLVQAGFEVHAAARRPLPELAPGQVIWHRVDALVPEAWAGLVQKLAPTHLLHLAWVATPGVYWSSPENLRWVESSLALLREFADSGGRRVVMSGT